jgi:hypothetical protein
VLLGVTASAFGQGTINFANAGAGVNARLFGTDGITPLAGTSYIAQLWAGSSASSVSPIVPTATFGTGANAGYFFGGSRAIPTVGQGSPAYAQLRVWEGSVPSWAIAINTPGCLVGWSDVFQTPYLGGGAQPPPNLIGLRTVPFHWIIVPEPSAILLGFLGVAGLLVLRRRR